MRQGAAFSPGWLRTEIETSLRQVADKPYIPAQVMESFKRAENAIKHSDSLQRSQGDNRRSEKIA